MTKNDVPTILITGATSDIGISVIELLLSEGYQIVIHARNKEKLADHIDLSNPQIVKIIIADFLDPVEVETTFRQELQEIILSGIVHCAGLHGFTPIKSRKISTAQSIMNVNYHSPMQVTKIATLSQHRDPSGMSIVWVSSVAARKGSSALLDYSASKAAVLAGSKVLAIELSVHKVRVNSIVTGWVDTSTASEIRKNFSEELNMTEISRFPLGLGTTQDVSNAISFLLSNDARWITGTELIADGGYLA